MRRGLLGCVVGLVLCAPAGAAEPYGLVAFSANGVPRENAEQAYRQLRNAGVDAIRIDINWLQAEPPGEPLHDFDFSGVDREVAAIRRAGLKVIGLLAYGHPDYSTAGGVVQTTPIAGGLPPIATGSAHFFPPDDPADFATYAAAAAGHFGDEVIAWEVWNEENVGARFWSPREDPAAYAELLCQAYDALKGVDPGTPVLFGGLFFPGAPGPIVVTSGPAFLDASYRAKPGLGRCSDAVAYHPYPYPFTSPEVEVPVRGSVLSAAGEMRAVLTAHGDGEKPLWISEIGWPTHDRSYGVPGGKAGPVRGPDAGGQLRAGPAGPHLVHVRRCRGPERRIQPGGLVRLLPAGRLAQARVPSAADIQRGICRHPLRPRPLARAGPPAGGAERRRAGLRARVRGRRAGP